MHAGCPWVVSQGIVLQSLKTNQYVHPGVILQQILVTPNLPFTVSHAILAVTTAKPPHGDPEFLEINKARATQPKPTTYEQKIAAARPTLELMYDKKWVVENRDKIDAKLPSLIFGRPPSVAGG